MYRKYVINLYRLLIIVSFSMSPGRTYDGANPISSCFDNVVNGTVSRMPGAGARVPPLPPRSGRGCIPRPPARCAHRERQSRANLCRGRAPPTPVAILYHARAPPTTTLSCIGVSDCPLNYSVSIRLRLRRAMRV